MTLTLNIKHTGESLQNDAIKSYYVFIMGKTPVVYVEHTDGSYYVSIRDRAVKFTNPEGVKGEIKKKELLQVLELIAKELTNCE